jgi:hypothetical protein
MFLYFNHQGELTTCITHGETPRQGNPLSVWVAVDKQYFKDKTPNTPAGWAVKVSVVYSETEATAPFPASYLGTKIFRKTNDSEITYNLIDGNSYYMYYCNIPAEYSTMQSGYKSLVTTFYTRKLLENGQYSDDEITEYNNEAYDIYIEKTFGKAQDTSTVTKNQYNTLKTRLDVLSTGAQKRIVKQDTKIGSLLDAVNSFCAGDSVAILYNDALVQVLSVEENAGNMAIFCLLEDTVLKFEFNENDNVDEVVTPEEVELSGSGGSGDAGIVLIDEILSEEEIKELYDNQENGKYSIKSEEFGDELIFINKDKELFKRFTAGYDYTFDFELNEWQIASGGGGAGGNIILRAVSPVEQTIGIGKQANITYFYKSPLGSGGDAYYYINGILRGHEEIQSNSNILFDVTKYLVNPITYTILIEVRDKNGDKEDITFTFNVVSLQIKSDFQEQTIRTNDFIIDIVAAGNFEKTVHVLIDENEKEEYEEVFTESTKEITISKLSHGTHTIEIFVTAMFSGEYVDSNSLKFTIIFADMTNPEIIIKSKFNSTNFEVGDVISIDYVIFNTQAETTNVQRLINGVVVQSPTDENGKQNYWNVTPDSPGNLNLTIKTENSEKQFDLYIDEATIEVSPVKSGLVLQMVADGKDNNLLEDRDKWSGTNSNDEKVVEATLTGFNWNTNGWQNKSGQKTFLRLNSTAKVIVPFKIFATDFLEEGKTIEFDFSTANVSDINKILITSFTENKGFILKSNECIIKSQQSEINTKFKEDERVKVSFVIQRSGSVTKLIKTFINGVMSGLVQYPYNSETGIGDNFTQSIPVDITINPDGGDIDIYSIRVYNKPLTDNEILQNYIADLDVNKKKNKYKFNDIFDDNGNIDAEIIKKNKLIPYLIFTGPELPQDKGDKKTMRVDYFDPINPNNDFSYENVVWDIQGTSSVAYPRKNWKGKFPESFAFYENGIPEDTYTFKADYMESSHSHNTGNAVFINTIAPEFPTQADNPNVRNTIYGFPILMFYRKSIDAIPEYQGVYNFNNHKGNSTTLG